MKLSVDNMRFVIKFKPVSSVIDTQFV